MKKVLALTLAVVLAFGMMAAGFAAAGDRITGFANDTLGLSKITFDKNGAATHKDTIDPNNMEVNHNDTIRFYLYPDDFKWSTGAALAKDPEVKQGNTMSTSNLSSLSVKASWKKGGEYFLSPELKYSTGSYTCYVELKTKKGITLTSDKDIDGKLVLTFKGEKCEVDLAGLVRNNEVPVDDDDSVWVTAGSYVKANEFVKAMEFNFETDDVYVYVNVFGGKKYYLWIEEDVLTKDEELIAKYDSIEAVFHAYYSTNVNVASTYTKFDLDDTYYAYNQDGKYLGTTNDKLALSGTYYLSSKKLDSFGASAEEVEEPGEAPDPAAPAANQNPAGGGDDAPSNANDNPGTGR